MTRPSRLGQCDLSLTFAEPFLVSCTRFAHAQMASNTLFVGRMCPIFRQQRPPAGMAQNVRPFAQPVLDTYPVVEHKAGALPCAFCFRHLFEVFQDPPLR